MDRIKRVDRGVWEMFRNVFSKQRGVVLSEFIKKIVVINVKGYREMK